MNVVRYMFADGMRNDDTRTLVDETPVAFEYNGFAFAVMLSTSDNIYDFAVGFTLSEGLANDVSDIEYIDIASLDNGVVVRIRLRDHMADKVRDRVRLRVVEGACGLCGITSLNEVLRPLRVFTSLPLVRATAIELALLQLPQFQTGGRVNGAMHLAAFCQWDGMIVAAREDVGRHNALDKLVGHLARTSINAADGFMLLTARCSVELVEKAARAGAPLLVTISLPSNLAVQRAIEAKLTLISLARADSFLIFNDPFKNDW